MRFVDPNAAADASPPARPRVAYIMSRFPKLTETFVVNEIVAMERLGQPIEIYPLMRERERVIQPAAVPLVARAQFTPFLSWSVITSQLHFLRRRPRAYIGALAALVKDNLGSRRLLLGGLALFPKIVDMARRMAAAGVEHVHCHFATHPALAGFVIGRLTGIPYSFTAHGSDIHRDRHMLCAKVREADFVIAIANANRHVIEKECGAAALDNVRVLHCGVDTSLLRRGDRRAATPSSSLRVISIGTLHEVKGQRHLIEACALLRDEGLAVTVELVGGGPDERTLRTQVRERGLVEQVRFMGALTHAEVFAALHRADVLVAPSVPSRDGRREGLPVVLMEAMATGLPVVASRLSGIPELVSHDVNGLLVEPGQPGDIADALRRLAQDAALRERLGSAGAKTVERDFNLDLNASRLADMFRRVAA